jgi:hypothetical protein
VEDVLGQDTMYVIVEVSLWKRPWTKAEVMASSRSRLVGVAVDMVLLLLLLLLLLAVDDVKDFLEIK